MNNIIERDRINQKITKIIQESIYTWLRDNAEITDNFTEKRYEKFVKMIEDIGNRDDFHTNHINILFEGDDEGFIILYS